jgi:CheY-like chemotaxis protein
MDCTHQLGAHDKLEFEARSSIHALLGALQALAEGPLREDEILHVEAARSHADRLLLALNDICSLLDPHVPQMARNAFQLPESIQEVVAVMGILAAQRDIAVHAQMDGTVPPIVVGDRMRLEEALTRALDCAIRFAGTPEIRISVDCQSRGGAPDDIDIWCHIHLMTVGAPRSRAGTDWQVAGPCPSDRLAARAEADITIIRRLLAPLGAAVQADQCRDGRLDMTLSIPFCLVEAPLPRAVGDLPRLVSAGASITTILPQKLLIAEDSDDSYVLIEAYLKSENYTLNRARNGAEAVCMAQSGDYDIIIMDVQMPLLNGYQAALAIRDWETRNGHHRTPIIVLSAERLQSQIRMGSAAGCSAFLTKPVLQPMLLKVLREYSPGARLSGLPEASIC